MADMKAQIKITADSKQATDAVKGLNQEFATTEERVNELNQVLEKQTENTQTTAAATEQLTVAAESASGASDDLGDAIGDAGTEAALATFNFEGLIKSVDRFEKQAKKFGREFSTLVTAPIVALAGLSLKTVFDTGALEGSTGVFRQMALAVEGLQRNFKLLLTDIGTQLAPVFLRVVGIFNTLINAYRSLDADTKSLINTLAGIAAIVGPAVLAFSTFLSIALKLTPVVVAIGKGLAVLGTFLASPVALFTALTTILVGLINVFVQLGRAGETMGSAFNKVFTLFATGFNKYITNTVLSGASIVIGALQSLTASIAPSLSSGLASANEAIEGFKERASASFETAKSDIDKSLESVGLTAGGAFTFGLSTSLSNLGDTITKALDNAGKNVDYSGLLNSEEQELAKLRQKTSDDMVAEFQKMQQVAFEKSKQIADTVSGNLSGAFLDFAEGSKTAQQAFADFARSTLRMLTELALRAQIMRAFFPSVAGGAPQAGTNYLGFAGSFAGGGMISGPGTGTSDSILARVSNGEFVNDARTVKHFGADFFHNLKSMARGGANVSSRKGGLSAFASGGLVTGASSAPQVIIENKGGAKEVVGQTFDPNTAITTIILDDLQRNGSISKGISNTFGMKRGNYT